MSLIYQFKQMA